MKKITLLMTLLVAMVTTAMAQITSLEDVNQNKCYVVTTVQGNRGGWSVTEDGSKFSSTFDVSGTKNYDITDKKQQFAFVKNTDGNYYLWSVGASKFVLSNMTLSANKGEAIQFNDASSYNKWDETQVQVQFVGNSYGYINLGGSNQMTIDWWGTVDDGNAVTLIEADDFDPTDALAMLDVAKLNSAKENLSSLIQKAESLVEYENYTWQTENPDAPYYITCPQEHNALNPNKKDGQGIAALVDGNPATFMHSAWENNPGGTHYILVDLGDGNSLNDLRIDYISRSDADANFIKEVTVYGSNDGSEFNQIAVTTGYPQSAGQSFRVIVENETA